MGVTFAAVPLTAEDLAAARIADDVCMHLNEERSVIRLSLRAQGDPAVYTARQQRLFTITGLGSERARDIHVSGVAFSYGEGDDVGWRWDSLDGWNSGDPAGPPRCFYNMWELDVWRTIVGGLRVGDRLRLLWSADDNNGYVTEAGLHTDRLQLAAEDPERKRIRAWNLGWSTCQDNSARMVRRFG